MDIYEYEYDSALAKSLSSQSILWSRVALVSSCMALAEILLRNESFVALSAEKVSYLWRR